MVKAIIFDLDGVISNTDRTRFDLLKILLKKRGLNLSDDDYTKSVGKRTEIFLKEVFGDRLNDAEIREIFIERKEIYHKNPAKYVLAQPYSFECCKLLHENGFNLAIASASEEKDIRLVLAELKLLPFFKVIVSSDLVENNKPHPDIYVKCIEKLDLLKEECIAIEDSPTGIKSAKSAGLTCIAVAYTHSDDELEEADRIINSLDKLSVDFVNQI